LLRGIWHYTMLRHIIIRKPEIVFISGSCNSQTIIKFISGFEEISHIIWMRYKWNRLAIRIKLRYKPSIHWRSPAFIYTIIYSSSFSIHIFELAIRTLSENILIIWQYQWGGNSGVRINCYAQSVYVFTIFRLN